MENPEKSEAWENGCPHIPKNSLECADQERLLKTGFFRTGPVSC